MWCSPLPTPHACSATCTQLVRVGVNCIPVHLPATCLILGPWGIVCRRVDGGLKLILQTTCRLSAKVCVCTCTVCVRVVAAKAGQGLLSFFARVVHSPVSRLPCSRCSPPPAASPSLIVRGCHAACAWPTGFHTHTKHPVCLAVILFYWGCDFIDCLCTAVGNSVGLSRPGRSYLVKQKRGTQKEGRNKRRASLHKDIHSFPHHITSYLTTINSLS